VESYTPYSSNCAQQTNNSSATVFFKTQNNTNVLDVIILKFCLLCASTTYNWMGL